MKSLLEKQRTLEEIVADANAGAPAGVAEPTAPATNEAPAEGALDADAESGQSSPSLTEGELEVARRVAKRMGWAPKEEWKRDPAKWEDAPQFLERTPEQLVLLQQRNAELLERTKRAAQAAEAALEDDRRRMLAEAEARVRAAAAATDPDAVIAAAKEVAVHSGPPPQTVAWIARNSWFKEDDGARAVAVTAIKKAEAAGLSIDDQLEAGEMAAKRRFPEYFGEKPAEREAPRTEEVRLSELPRRAPAVQQGTRTVATPQSKEKGYADIPWAVRTSFEQSMLRRFTNRGVPADQAKANYARNYWAELRE